VTNCSRTRIPTVPGKLPGGNNQIRAVAPQFVTDVHYRTCLCTLMLEVYYRFLPGTGAGVR
jgi:hypothetical protein